MQVLSPDLSTGEWSRFQELFTASLWIPGCVEQILPLCEKDVKQIWFFEKEQTIEAHTSVIDFTGVVSRRRGGASVRLRELISAT